MSKLRLFLLVAVVLSAIASTSSSFAQQQQLSSASDTIVFQLQTTSIPRVRYADYYYSSSSESATTTNNNAPYCKYFHGVFPEGEVNSYEGIRRELATLTNLPLHWITIFPNDGIAAKFIMPYTDSYQYISTRPTETPVPEPAPTAGPNESSTTATTTTSTTTSTSTTTTTSTTTMTTTDVSNQTSSPTTVDPMTTAEPSAPSSPSSSNTGIGSNGLQVQVYAVWVMIKLTNATSTSSAASSLTPAQKQAANQELLRLSTNIGDSSSLATMTSLFNGSTTIDPSVPRSDYSILFSLTAMDFGYPISTSPMRQQQMEKTMEWLNVYNDEWDRFLVGMIAVTILGTAAYITAHCFIHRVAARGPLVTAGGNNTNVNSAVAEDYEMPRYNSGGGGDNDSDEMKVG